MPEQKDRIPPQKQDRQPAAEPRERTFRTNIFSYFFIAKAALPHDGSSYRTGRALHPNGGEAING